MKKHDKGYEWVDHLVRDKLETIKQREHASSKDSFLIIDLIEFDFPLVFNELEYSLTKVTLRETNSSMITVFDSELFQDNPIEAKHRKLARSHRTGPLDRELKPSAKIRDDIYNILGYSPTKALLSEEKDLLWKFRFYLIRDKKALTKFLKAVSWSDPVEEKQAVDLLGVWVDIDVEDALELLGPNFNNIHVRNFAVTQLRKAEDEVNFTI
jgi:phosphatidylinositol 3-kinase